MNVGGGDKLVLCAAKDKRAAFIRSAIRRDLRRCRRQDTAASFTIDAMSAAGTPWPETSAIGDPAWVSAATMRS
jgi:hypothetical protein